MKKIIVFGNQKGGTGKSTLAMHLIVSLLIKGYKVAAVDVDATQGTLTRYLENREQTQIINKNILMPKYVALFDNNNDSVQEKNKNNLIAFNKIIESFSSYDYIIVDTPGNDSSLSKIAHSFADILITPMNESFIDLDLIIKVNKKSNNLCTSAYAEEVWSQKKARAKRDKGIIDWVILLNRMSSNNSKNQKALEKILTALAKRLGFRVARGFKDRMIFKELFLSGLTLLDGNSIRTRTTLSHIAARQELNDLLVTLDIN